MNIGCHVSIAGGIANAPKRAFDLGCEAMQIFTRSPQGGKAPEITKALAQKFRFQVSSFKLRQIYIHTPYYINLPSLDNKIRYSSSKVIREELERGSLIEAKYVMTHLGSARKMEQKDAIKKTCEMLQKSLDGYEGTTKLLFENSAGAGDILGDDLKELGEMLEITNNPHIAGICLDTQHSFASGYNWLDFENTLKKIDSEIGLENIKLIHANDSATELNSKKDRHAHIGQGNIDLDAFKKITAFAKKNNIDMICETEDPGNKEDIVKLKELRNL